MTLEQFKIPKEELEKITEYVIKGIASSKASESNFYGDSLNFHKKMEERIVSMDNILTKLDTKIDFHDETIQIVTKLLPALEEAIDAYKSTSIIGKAVIGLILGVPAIAGFIAGILYMVGLLNSKQ